MQINRFRSSVPKRTMLRRKKYVSKYFQLAMGVLKKQGRLKSIHSGICRLCNVYVKKQNVTEDKDHRSEDIIF